MDWCLKVECEDDEEPVEVPEEIMNQCLEFGFTKDLIIKAYGKGEKEAGNVLDMCIVHTDLKSTFFYGILRNSSHKCISQN